MKVEAIWLKRARRGPMDAVARVRAVPGIGLEGNTEQGGKRQVTLLSADQWRSVEEELGAEVDPRARRANLFVSGTDFEGSRGRVLKVGGSRILIHGETRPCERMNQGHPDLRRALGPEWRAGAYGEVLEGGEIEVGDAVAWEGGAALRDAARTG